ncbi:MAG: hypothetical protein AB1453_09495 [Chloroflexota bacterium]|jgi:hypothetical protein
MLWFKKTHVRDKLFCIPPAIFLALRINEQQGCTRQTAYFVTIPDKEQDELSYLNKVNFTTDRLPDLHP